MSTCGSTFAECVCGLEAGHWPETPHVCLEAPHGVTCGGSWNEPTGEGIVRYPSLASVAAGMRALGCGESEIEALLADVRAATPPDLLNDVIDVDDAQRG